MTPTLTPPPLTGAEKVAAMQAAEALITRLHGHFGVAHPIQVTWGSGNGRAYPLKHGAYRITLSHASQMGIPALTLHEFSHVLEFHRTERSGHNYRFFRTLLEVMTAAGVSPSAYPWEREYAVLNGFAQQARYTTKPTVKQTRANEASVIAATNGVRVGATVQWTSPKHGAKTGRVVSLQRGCRAKVLLPSGGFWMVPPSWLTVVSPLAAAA